MKIRRAKATDAARLAELSGQLGYPCSKKEMTSRLRKVLRHKASAAFVAEEPAHGVIGWVHVSITPLLEVARRAEVNGLVVDEHIRSHGAGWALLQAAEKWAHAKKCKAVSVRSNVIRDRAHGFYLRHGYEHYKTQKAFRKPL